MEKWIKKHLKEKNIQDISEAVAKAELKTSGEIVPVIVEKSSTVGHVPVKIVLLAMVFILFFEPYWVHSIGIDLLDIRWIWIWVPIITVLYLLGVYLSRFYRVQKLFVTEEDEMSQVMARAELEFYRNSIRYTYGGTGILIFVSVMERKAVILAGQSIYEKCPPDLWKKEVNELSTYLKKNQWAQGFIHTIERSGELLKTHFPRSENDLNELPNHLVIKR